MTGAAPAGRLPPVKMSRRRLLRWLAADLRAALAIVVLLATARLACAAGTATNTTSAPRYR
jgi:hypothetical protein